MKTLEKISFVEKVELALDQLKKGQGVLVTDDEDRENEADIIYSAEFLIEQQVATMIRECSGIVCLCLPESKVEELNLPMMTTNNNSKFQTAFTVSIEAKEGVTTGVSAKDRLTTIKTAIAQNAKPEDIVSPGHVFPLKARAGGVLERAGHTEATVDLMKLANLQPYGVLCELTNKDGTMAKDWQIKKISELYNYPIVTVKDIIQYRNSIS